ncbi:MAG: hypothetical protein RRY34_08285, partial [Victivallaceae bacterium]
WLAKSLNSYNHYNTPHKIPHVFFLEKMRHLAFLRQDVGSVAYFGLGMLLYNGMDYNRMIVVNKKYSFFTDFC